MKKTVLIHTRSWSRLRDISIDCMLTAHIYSSSNGDLYLAASTPIPAPSVVKGHKKNRSSLGASRRPARVPKFDDDADFTGGF